MTIQYGFCYRRDKTIKRGLYYRCDDNKKWFWLQAWQDNKMRSLLQVCDCSKTPWHQNTTELAKFDRTCQHQQATKKLHGTPVCVTPTPQKIPKLRSREHKTSTVPLLVTPTPPKIPKFRCSEHKTSTVPFVVTPTPPKIINVQEQWA